jgi:hypothetical protein
MLGLSFVTTARSALGLWMEERPPVMQGSCIHIEYQPWRADKGRSSSFGVGHGIKKPSPEKNKLVMNCSKQPRTWMNSLDKQPDRIFGT